MSGKFFLFITIILFMLIFFCIPALAALQQEAPLSPEQTQLNLESLEYIWKTINEKHYDPTFGGVDWPALREEMRPRMEKAKTRNEVRAILEEMIDQLRMDRFAYWRQAYQKVETVGVEEVSGKSCFKVTATPAAGPVQTLYFDPETHLVIKIATTIETPQGTIPVESSFSDYQATNGVLLPRKSVMKVATQERIVTVQSIEQNVELPTDRFDAPKEIKTMLQKKNSN